MFIFRNILLKGSSLFFKITKTHSTFIFLSLVISTIGAQSVDFSTLIASGENPLELNPDTNYVGGAFISQSLTINGNGATIDLDGGAPDAFQALQINNGSTVTISNLNIQDGPFAGIEVVGTSRLNLDGSSINGPGRGVHLREASVGSISNSTISGDYVGVEALAGSTAIIDQSQLSARDYTAILFEDASGSVLQSHCSGSASSGIRSTNSSFSITDTSIAMDGGFGLAAAGTSPLNITNCQVLNVSDRGLYLENMPVTISGLLITTSNDNITTPTEVSTGTYGVTILNSPEVTLSDISIYGVDKGLEIFDPQGGVAISHLDATINNQSVTIERMAENQTAQLSNLNFSTIENVSLNLVQGKARIDKMHLNDAGVYAVRIHNDSHAEISNTDILDCALENGAGIELVDSEAVLLGNVRIENTVSSTSQGYGILGTRSVLEVRPGNTIIGQNLGIHLLDNSSVDVRKSEFHWCGEAIFTTNSDVYAEDCIMYHNVHGQAVQAEGHCDVTFRRNKVTNCYESGVGLNLAGTALVEDCYFADLRLGGIACSPLYEDPQYATVRRNTIYRPGNPAGLYATGVATPFTLNSIHNAKKWGIHNLGENNTFNRNFLIGSEEQIVSASGSGAQTFHHNVFVKGKKGFQAFEGPVDLVGNDFKLIGDGIGIDHAVFINQAGSLENAKYNNFGSTTHHGLYAEFTGQPDATLNWWGDASGPNENSAYGPGTGSEVIVALFEPWLTAPMVHSWWEEDVSVTANQPTNLIINQGPLHGQLAIDSPTTIEEMTSAMWASPINQTGVDPSTALPEIFGALYITVINDARIHIDGGTVNLLADQQMLSTFGLPPETTKVLVFDEETKQWNELASQVEGTNLKVQLPYHSASICLVRTTLSPEDYLNHLTGEEVICPPDLNTDHQIDVSDLLFFLFP
jgi:Right handed beta helix region